MGIGVRPPNLGTYGDVSTPRLPAGGTTNEEQHMMIKRGRCAVGAAAAGVAIGLALYVGYGSKAAADTPAAQPAAARLPIGNVDPLAAAGADMARAATHFLAALKPEQQAKATFEFKNDERYNWHFVPRERKGLPLKEMAPEQRELAHALLASGLGQRGLVPALTIISLEQILKDMEQGRGPARDPEMYFVSVFGKPGEKETWGWRVEGHHLAINFTVVGGRAVSGGPLFMGSNPGVVRDGPRKGLRVLAAEEDLGRQLVQSLDSDQKKIAIFSADAPKEIITGNQRKAQLENPGGIPVSKLNEQQRQVLMSLLDLYANRLRSEMAENDLKRIMAAGIEKVHFAWAGGTELGEPHYYRLSGPTFLVEYDNTQNNANHVHTAWRDLENDFGEDSLRRHYEQEPHGGAK
jgi:hypothetical protein